jgi:HD-like signal output (HDOD) protein
MRGLRNLIYTYGSQKIFEKKYAEMRELWQHSYRVAYYASSLARSFRRKNEVVDDVFVGGILHELGKIVANSLHPELVDKITIFCRAKEIPEKLLEDMAIGLNYPEIGAMIATKWNFPDQLVSTIRWHREPLECEPEHIDIVYTVYLAKAICLLEKGEIDFGHLEPLVLKHFGIESEEQLSKITDRIQRNFQEDKLPDG